MTTPRRKAASPRGRSPRGPRATISSFDSRFKDLLLMGSLKPITLHFPDRASAEKFRVRLHTYRARARKELSPAEATPLERCKVAFRPHPSGQATIILSPWDTEFSPIFEQAGLRRPSASTPPADLLADLAPAFSQEFSLEEDADS